MAKVTLGEFAPDATITMLVPQATIVGSCKGNPAKLYGLLQNGQTVASYMAQIRPLKGTLCELRKGIHKGWLAVSGVNPAAYSQVHGTLYKPGPHPNGKPTPRGPRVSHAQLWVAAALVAHATLAYRKAK